MKSKLNKILLTSTAAITSIAPISLMTSCSCGSEVVFDLTIAGDASYDEGSSKLELNKDSTIVLVPPASQEINSIRKVKVGTKLLGSDSYSYDKESRTLTIKASAMTNTSIYIETDTVATAEIVAVTIKNKPTTLTYPQGYYLNLSGLEVVAITKTGQKIATTNYTTSIEDNTRLMDIGTKTVTVKLNGTQLSDSFDITVGQPIVEKIEITTQPTNRIYTVSDTLSFAGLKLKATKSNDEVDTDFKEYTAVPAQGSSFTSTGYKDVTFTCDKGQASTQIYVTTDPVKFADASWENVSDWTYCLEAGIATEEDFCNHFLNSSGQPYSSLSAFVGQEKTVTVNKLSHRVRVIDVEHDEIAEDYESVKKGTKATFTFQFANTITSSTYALKCYYDGYNLDFINSQLRFNLNKQGSETEINWYSPASIKSSIFQLLPSGFDKYIWTVKKEAATIADSESKPSLKTYNDKIFIPTMTEYAQNPSSFTTYTFMAEGQPYKYWSNGSSRKISSVGAYDDTSYHLTTLALNTSGYAAGTWVVDTDGDFAQNIEHTSPQNGSFNVAPCFCM